MNIQDESGYIYKFTLQLYSSFCCNHTHIYTHIRKEIHEHTEFRCAKSGGSDKTPGSTQGALLTFHIDNIKRASTHYVEPNGWSSFSSCPGVCVRW